MSRPLTGLSAPEAALHRLSDQLADRYTGVFTRVQALLADLLPAVTPAS